MMHIQDGLTRGEGVSQSFGSSSLDIKRSEEKMQLFACFHFLLMSGSLECSPNCHPWLAREPRFFSLLVALQQSDPPCVECQLGAVRHPVSWA